MIKNDFWALGPNVKGYAGAYPNGFLERCRAERIWGKRRLHVCSGTVEDGVTLDASRETKGVDAVRPRVQAGAEALPFRDASFDFVLADPPYEEKLAEELYGQAMVSIPRLLEEAARVTRPGGLVGVLSWHVWPPPMALGWMALIAVYNANRGPKPLRAFCVYRRGDAPLAKWMMGD